MIIKEKYGLMHVKNFAIIKMFEEPSIHFQKLWEPGKVKIYLHFCTQNCTSIYGEKLLKEYSIKLQKTYMKVFTPVKSTNFKYNRLNISPSSMHMNYSVVMIIL